MGKYNRIGFACIFLLSSMLSGCKGVEEEPVTITVIHAWGGMEADHVAMRDIYEGFEKENSDIRLQLISMPTSIMKKFFSRPRFKKFLKHGKNFGLCVKR